MSDYIKREEALAALCLNCVWWQSKDGCKRGICDKYNALLGLYAADVRENVHGKWEDRPNGWMCSVCHTDHANDSDFCPACGADMRGDSDE